MRPVLHRAMAALLGLQLMACASDPRVEVPEAPQETPASEPVPIAEPLSEKGNQSPYRVRGRTYRVLPSSHGYVKRGTASWYGPNFHGRLTSNQEVFDMHQYSAAHRSLPLPTWARVTHLGNGRSVVVRINDRGPFKDNRLIDLSYAAAKALGMIEEGTAEVEVRVLDPGRESLAERPEVRSAPGIYLQLGAFSSRANAMSLLKRLRDEAVPGVHLHSVSPSEGVFVHRVRVGPLADVKSADEWVATLTLLGLERPRVVFE